MMGKGSLVRKVERKKITTTRGDSSEEKGAKKESPRQVPTPLEASLNKRSRKGEKKLQNFLI